MKFKEYVAFANVLVAHGQPSYLASILHIAKFSLHPYDTSQASLYKSAVAEKVEAKAVRTVNHIQTSAKGPSSSSNSKESELFAQVASLQTQFNSMRKAFPKASASAPTYNRSPPPTAYTASSPYPSIAVGRGPLSKGSRNCAPPSDGVGLPPNLGFTAWDESLWRRARAKVSVFARLASHPTCDAALAKCRPCDESMTKPRIDDIQPVASGVAWTNENECAYCAFRPRAPPDTPAEEDWKYGTGDGAHNPIVCQSFIRNLCEAGAGEFSADDHLKKIIRSLVGIKPIA
jgi:hypothetical protein